MKRNIILKCLVPALMSAILAIPSLADDQPTAAQEAKKANDGEMMAKMMELAQPGPEHKRLAGVVGTWSYTVKYWFSPDAPPNVSTGTAVAREVMSGRYFITEHTGKMQMPGADGKMLETEFKGMSVEGFDNVKKKFVSSWIDNMGTGIMNSEGTYDADSKTLTYRSEYEPMPGMKTKVRETVKIADKDHHTFEFFEDRGGTEVKTMEIQYVRKS